MLSFHYVITDEEGIHARSSGFLVREAIKYKSKVVIKKDGKTAEATDLMEIMDLGVQWGETVEVEVSGPDEGAACEAMKALFEENM